MSINCLLRSRSTESKDSVEKVRRPRFFCHAPSLPLENMLLLRCEDFDKLLDRVAGLGTERATDADAPAAGIGQGEGNKQQGVIERRPPSPKHS